MAPVYPKATSRDTSWVANSDAFSYSTSMLQRTRKRDAVRMFLTGERPQQHPRSTKEAFPSAYRKPLAIGIDGPPVVEPRWLTVTRSILGRLRILSQPENTKS